MNCRIAVLVSGSGTNLQALMESAERDDCPAEIAVVVSNRGDAFGLERARQAGIEAVHVPHLGKERVQFERDLVSALQTRSIDWVFLAGFGRILTPVFLDAFAGRVLNIHPALLPRFPGLHAQQQAYDAGVLFSGATVHFVDAGTDTGPIIAQGVVSRLAADTVEDFSSRILRMEHRLYPMVLRWVAHNRLEQIDGTAAVQLNSGEARVLFDK
jgi:phosphoribosylglycinamide formyltransferase-1